MFFASIAFAATVVAGVHYLQESDAKQRRVGLHAADLKRIARKENAD